MPFIAVAAANFVNIPLMRQNELIYGIDVYDENGNKVGNSRVCIIFINLAYILIRLQKIN